MAVLWNVAYPGKDLEFRETQAAARALGITLQSVEVRSAPDLDQAFAAIRSGPPDALITFSDPFTPTHRRRIVDFATKIRVPMISEIREFADALVTSTGVPFKSSLNMSSWRIGGHFPPVPRRGGRLKHST